jgi:hypothetical protein
LDYEKWDKSQLVAYLEFADKHFPEEMGKIFLAFDEMRRGN